MKQVIRRASSYCTDYLFSQNGFLIGMGSVLNVAGNYFEYNYSESGSEADARALASDWGAIGQDIRWAMSESDLKPKYSLKLVGDDEG